MNTPNNKRRRESRERIERAFMELLEKSELNKISVTDICKLSAVNRTTFYANYLDIYDLAEAVQTRLEGEVLSLYVEEQENRRPSHDFLKLFCHIKENPGIYKTYFMLNADGKLRFTSYDHNEALNRFEAKYIDYHIEFFAAGLNAIIKKWLENDCRESPEEIYSILKAEYRGMI